MILLLDAGNSRIKWAIWQAGRWSSSGAVPVGRAAELETVLADAKPKWIGISCVSGEAVERALTGLCGATGIAPHWLRPAAAGHGLVNGYARPDSLGADRYAIAIAVLRMGLAPCVAVSAGTAVTVDAITGAGELLGGMILPGIGLMRRSLATGTAALAGAEGVWQPFPTATGDAIATGILTAIASSVSAMQGRLSDRIGKPAGIVVTGGDAAVLADHLSDVGCDVEIRVMDNLVLEGLLWVARDLGAPGV